MGKWEMTILNPAQHTEANSSYLQAEQGCQSMEEESFFKKKKKQKKNPVQMGGRMWHHQRMGGEHIVSACPALPRVRRPQVCGQPGQTYPLQLVQGTPELRGAVQPLGLEEGLQGCSGVPGPQQDRVLPCPHRGCGDTGAPLARSQALSPR